MEKVMIKRNVLGGKTHVVGQEDLAELDHVRVEQPRVVDQLAADVLLLFCWFEVGERK